jgi:hypothetical protein
MPHGFDFYRIYVSAPGDLEPDRQACYDAIAQVNETTAMQAHVLLTSVGLRENEQITASRGIVSDNVRWSSYFIQLFKDDWGTRDVFRELFLLAVECRDDPAMPMRDVVVCLKNAPHQTNAEVLAFRSELENRKDLRVLPYGDIEELKAQLTAVCNEWAATLVGSKADSAAAPRE